MKNVNSFIGSVAAMYAVLPVIRKSDIVDTGKARLQVVSKSAGEKQNMLEFADLNRHGARVFVHPSKFAASLIGRTINVTDTEDEIPVDPDVATRAELKKVAVEGDALMSQIEKLGNEQAQLSKRTKAYKAIQQQLDTAYEAYEMLAEAHQQLTSELCAITVA